MHDYPMQHDQRQWDSLCCVRGQNQGTYAEGAPRYPEPQPYLYPYPYP